jgi:hypothetical protein
MLAGCLTSSAGILSIWRRTADSISLAFHRKMARYMKSVVPAPSSETLSRGSGALVDQWNSITWLAPMSIINDNGVPTLGAPKAQGTGVYGLHLLTPETERSTMHYFVAVRQNSLPFPESVRQDIKTKLKSMRGACNSGLCPRHLGVRWRSDECLSGQLHRERCSGLQDRALISKQKFPGT